MWTTSKRLMAALMVTSLGLGSFVPPAVAQTLQLPSEQTPLEQSEQPMPLPVEPPLVQAPAPAVEPPTMAQVQPTPPPPPPPAVTPAPAPPVAPAPVQPDIFQETLKAQRASERHSGLYAAGAVVTNIFLIPGRAITCTVGAGIGVGLLAITFGTGYKAAAAAWDEGCGGKWVVNGDDLRPEGSRAFEWER